MRLKSSFTWATVLLASFVLAENPPAPANAQLSCGQPSDCPVDLCVGGGAIGSCVDGKCVCDHPGIPVPTQPPPKPYCYQENPVEGKWSSAFCRCDLEGTTKTLQQITVPGGDYFASCDYTYLPTGTEAPVVKITEPPKPKPYCYQENPVEGKWSSAFCRCEAEGTTKTLQQITVPGGDYFASCDYTSLPTGTAAPVVEIEEEYTIGCQICHSVGGRANHKPEHCYDMKDCVENKPVGHVFMSKTGVSVGLSLNGNDGSELGKKLIEGLKTRCLEHDATDNEFGCGTEEFDVAEVKIIQNKGEEPMMLKATVNAAAYRSNEARNWLMGEVARGLTTGAKNNCEKAEYAQDFSAGSGCPDHGALGKRDLTASNVHSRPRDGFIKLLKRVGPDGIGDKAQPKDVCRYRVDMCTGPDFVHAVKGTTEKPYSENLHVVFKLVRQSKGDPFENKWAQWACETLIGKAAGALQGPLPDWAWEAANVGIGGPDGAVAPIQDLALEVSCGTPPRPK